ncbi:hypothetical protein Z951_21365 [Streptomyces sp. PRh5]|uniref:DUF1707 SHOCT-like domain-containing protein n=1 Tax=Streptomyces sp. PRh5 TaxID=1158056 RepID=UPI000452D02F|nr:DUF1707 domain-containing protein [Streptomyces sp. PRh5]EXU66152.1 hypothetical protein Z951_21365 [Streptomyces sp. PRh5]
MSSVPENVPPRISEVDRDAAVQRLQDAYAEGHIPNEEMDARLQAALTATTHGELTSALESLPARDAGPTVIVNTAGGLIQRRGRWQVPRHFKVTSNVGKVYLDLSRAVIEYPVVDIELHLPYGWARLIVPPDATVDFEDLHADWKQPVYKNPGYHESNGPRIRISGTMGYGRLRIKHRRG